MGGSGGACPPRNLHYPCLAPPGSGGLRPPGISVNYPCLASAAAVPCPSALPPIFFRRNFLRPIFSSVVGPSSVHPSFVRPSVEPYFHRLGSPNLKVFFLSWTVGCSGRALRVPPASACGSPSRWKNKFPLKRFSKKELKLS